MALNERSNGHTITVRPGSHLTLTLHSTFWSLAPLKSALVITQVGQTIVVRTPPHASKACVPGQGCGTLSAGFVATHAGVIRLRTTRTSCGEALHCTPAQSVWTVLVHVGVG